MDTTCRNSIVSLSLVHGTEGDIIANKTSTLIKLSEEIKPALQEEAVDGISLEADYMEDRTISLLAERQRDFHEILDGHYVDVEMPTS